MRPRAISRPRLSQGRLNVSIESRRRSRLFSITMLSRWIVAARRRRLLSGKPRRPKCRRFAQRADPHVSILASSARDQQQRQRDGCSDLSVLPSSAACPRRRGVCGRVSCDRTNTHDRSNERTTSSFSLLLRLRPEIRRDYPLNLSILISGGKETNQDSLSNGE